MITPGAQVKSKIEQPWPSLIKEGSEGRAMMNVAGQGDVWLCVFDGNQVHMNASDLEVVE